MGQYCFARLCLSSVVVCNAAGGRAREPAAGRVGGRAADTARRASTVTVSVKNVAKVIGACWNEDGLVREQLGLFDMFTAPNVLCS